MSLSPHIPGKVDLTPRRHHGYAVLLFIMGTLFPPLAVAARFGIGRDFWINILLTICGYIPGHGHNFYIQNIRNNKSHARTPKWAQKWGLIDTSEIKRKERRSQWAGRFNDRLPHSTLEDQPLAEGQEAGSSSIDLPSQDTRSPKQPNANGDLWRPEDERFYNQRDASGATSGRWHYPANFDDAELTAVPKKNRKKKDKKDRWERTQDAYNMSEERSRKKKKSSKRKSRRSSASSIPDDSSRNSGTIEQPEDPEGGLYGNSTRIADADTSTPNANRNPTPAAGDIFDHQF
ncbi:hypothetical protein AGABI2DRAFT_190484 [Agaricus bisporus var. bisporus H97]|uniref:hypothetical protein n=1 Tax=Agaricus bisporus var. bisporus (strain H97 / ATCC MYA-4626 / FGSC 10389) TaxID=936046 RepID=UPI00029F6CE0|nr:hypothetical protein AGABI2DRAFT_190484 [Agaricus bisporus var. bisporus H97]EKV50080.1 hypothetical protein AGABI2DRAFT_190484 [Agaricus bisporus var. bisporus H97]